MRKTTLRITALLLALLMMLSLALVSCDETDDPDKDDDVENTDKDGDKDGDKDTDTDKDDDKDDNNGVGGSEGDGETEKPDIGFEGDEIANTKENAKILLNGAVNKFKDNTSVKYTLEEDYMGDIETDTIIVFTNENGDVVYYEITDVGEYGFEYVYAAGYKEYLKGLWGIDEYELDEKVTMQLVLENMFDYIFGSDPEGAIANLCTAEIKVGEEGDRYIISLDTDDAVEFFTAMLGEEGAQNVAGDGTAFSAFNGKIKIEFYADGNFSKIAFSYSASAGGETASMGYVYSFEKYNDPSITVEKPDWVIDCENEDEEDEGDEGGATPEYPEYPGIPGYGEGTDDPDDTDDPGDILGNIGTAEIADNIFLLHALNAVKKAFTLTITMESSDGLTTNNAQIMATNGQSDSAKAHIFSSEYEEYIDGRGNIYNYSEDTVTKSPCAANAFDYIFQNYLANYGILDPNGTLDRMIDAGLIGIYSGEKKIYVLETTYVEYAKIIDPNIVSNEGFQNMVASLRSSKVKITYTVGSDGYLEGVSADVSLSLANGAQMIIVEKMSVSVNKLNQFLEPDWLRNVQ